MKNDFFQFLGLAKRAGKILEGYNKCEDGIKHHKVFLILLTSTVSKNTLNKFKNYAEKFNIPVIENIDGDKISGSIGVDIIKVLGISDKNISRKLIDIWK
ncbi:50S ribosomal protein L7ae-like protein [Clostridium fermenticellae]|uniref:50S ribosomal protein L7ae-like protein n=1 Tax=Clostridium fermenticellae TaxID=2068654 RepID=A0A386H317_9CLOT|nr:ribosomal L7Ae/L30e/S12e/Gadd45 family protein [Clostridium fermenticellae]AYD40070.1 50S ribosomal protein L7ae-like protein [Clostridium fermenticellae]